MIHVMVLFLCQALTEADLYFYFKKLLFSVLIHFKVRNKTKTLFVCDVPIESSDEDAKN